MEKEKKLAGVTKMIPVAIVMWINPSLRKGMY